MLMGVDICGAASSVLVWELPLGVLVLHTKSWSPGRSEVGEGRMEDKKGRTADALLGIRLCCPFKKRAGEERGERHRV